MSMTVEQLFEKLGRDRITREQGHTPQVLSRAAIDGLMPAHWYPGIRAMCEAEAIACPHELFRWERKKPERRDKEGRAA